MDKWESQIIRLLLNEMAFEGASVHFKEAPPTIDAELFSCLVHIGAPEKYSRETENYRAGRVEFDDEKTVFENCYRYLRVIRNNIIHANKAYKPDTPERLSELLDWSDMLIDAVYETDSDFAVRAREIKRVLNITSF